MRGFDDVAEWSTVAELQAAGALLVEDGNHGEYRPRPDEFVDDGPSLFIRAADMSDGHLRFEDAKPISQLALDRIRKGIGRPGDVLFSHKGTVGKVALAPPDSPPFVCSPQTTFWRTMDESVLDRRFLHAFLRSPSFVFQWHGRKGETDMADYVSLTAQRRLRVPLIPIDLQRRIGSTVAGFDDLIENNRRRVEILEEMARLLYREWFVHFRFPGHEDVGLADSELGPIPEGWEASTVGDVAECFDRKRVPLSKMQRAEMQGSYPYYGAAKIFDYVNDFIFDGEHLLLGEDGTVVDDIGGPLLQLVNGKFWCNNHAHVLRGTAVSTRRLWCALHGYPIAGHVTGAAQPKITQANMNRIPILLPDSEAGEKFDSAIDPMIDLRFNLEAQNRVLREGRDLLLPRLVSGELDVSELDMDGVLA